MYHTFTNYQNYKGGVNNLQVTKIFSDTDFKCPVKVFTSTVNQAERYANRWIKKQIKIDILKINIGQIEEVNY